MFREESPIFCQKRRVFNSKQCSFDILPYTATTAATFQGFSAVVCPLLLKFKVYILSKERCILSRYKAVVNLHAVQSEFSSKVCLCVYVCEDLSTRDMTQRRDMTHSYVISLIHMGHDSFIRSVTLYT